MATALTAGRVYFIESDAGNQDWITAGGDPDVIDLDNFTEGVDYVEINMPEGFAVTGDTGAIVTPSGAGKSYDQRSARRFYKALQRGIATSIANSNLVDKFAMSDRHTSGASATFVRYFMICYLGVNSHLEFTDPNDNRKSYCRGIILNCVRQWFSRDPANILLRINWDSVW